MAFTQYEDQRATEQIVLLPMTVKEARAMIMMIELLNNMAPGDHPNVLKVLGALYDRLDNITPKKKGK